jgi:hypothetical protein
MTANHPTETISAADADGSFGAKPEAARSVIELPLSADFVEEVGFQGLSGADA